MLALVGPLLEVDLRAPILDVIGATDASEDSLGMCGVRVVESLAVRPYGLCEGPGAHVYLVAPYVVLPADLVNRTLAATPAVPLAWHSIGSRC